MLNVGSNIASDNQRMSDIISNLSSEHPHMSDAHSRMNDLAIKQETNFQQLFTDLHDFHQEVRNKLGDANKKQELFFETIFKEHREIERLKANIKFELDDLNTKQREFFGEKSTEQEKGLSQLKTIIKDQHLSQHSEHEEKFKVLQNILVDCLLKLRNDMSSELKVVSEKILNEQDGNLRTVSEKLCEQDERLRTVHKKLCEQDEKLRTVLEIVTEQQQQHLTSFQNLSCELKDLSRKQELQLSQQDEKLQYVQNILAEHQQKQPIKLQELFGSQQEKYHKIVQNVQQTNLQKILSSEVKALYEKQQSQLLEHIQTIAKQQEEKQTRLQKILSSELKGFSEKQRSQMSEHIKSLAGQLQAQDFRKQWVNKQRETDIQLKELCDQIQKWLSAVQKKLEPVEARVQKLAEGPDYKSKRSTTSQTEFSSSANVGQGILFMGDVVVGGHVIGKVDIREVFEGNKTLQDIQIQNIDNWNITFLKEAYENQKTKPKGTRSFGTMTEALSWESRTGAVVQHQNVEEKMVVLGGINSNGIIESYSAENNTWAADANNSGTPSGETLGVAVGAAIIVFEIYNKKTRLLVYASKRWTNLKSPPVYREGMKAAVDGNLIYLTGGYKHLTRCDVYDFQTNQWSKGPNLTAGRHFHGSATLGGKIYCCGGRDEMWENVISSAEVFDPRKEGKGKWTSVADMKVARGSLGLTSCSRFLWAVGGCGSSTLLKDLERYDPVYDIWTKMADMKIKRSRLSVCFFSGKLYAIGGYNNKDESCKTVEAYDHETNKWAVVAHLNQERHEHSSWVVQLPSD